MKKTTIAVCALLLAAAAAHAQQSLNVTRGGVTYSFPSEGLGRMPINDGKTLTIAGNVFDLTDISMDVVAEVLEDNTVTVIYSDNVATVSVAGNLAAYVEAEVTGAHVSITQSDEVGETTCGEIKYILKGQSSDGSFTQTGSYKSTIELQGLTLTNPSGAAIDIQNGKRIALSAKNGTENVLVDGAGGKQKAALYCKGHLELKGKGSLSVTGNTAHAISAKEYIEVKNLTLTIPASVKDGINCNQYLAMASGTVHILNPGDDGIQVSYKDDTDREAEDTGTFTISGGDLIIDDITARSAKAIKCDGDFEITGGTIKAKTSASGEWDSAKAKTKASACIGTDGEVRIKGGELNLTATGHGGKGINCDGALTASDGKINISTSGNMLVYANNTLYEGNYTGSTDRLSSDAKSSPKGIKADGAISISGGDFDVKVTGTGGEGIESKSTLTIDGGTVKVRAYDDAINSSSHMYINGGVVDVISSKNDGLDSNGNLCISGGVVMAIGGSSPECGLDANDEEGYSVIFTGGYILGLGGGSSYPRSTASTQPYVTATLSATAGSEVSIASGTDVLYTFTIPSDYSASASAGGNRPGGMSGSTMVISVPGLTSGNSYTVKSGSSSANATAKLTGSSTGPGGRF